MEKNAFKLNEKFTKGYNEESYKAYILEIDVEFPQKAS